MPTPPRSHSLLRGDALLSACWCACCSCVLTLRSVPKQELLAVLRSMVHWVTFVTPVFEKKRFDTPFYLLLLPPDIACTLGPAAWGDVYVCASSIVCCVFLGLCSCASCVRCCARVSPACLHVFPLQLL